MTRTFLVLFCVAAGVCFGAIAAVSMAEAVELHFGAYVGALLGSALGLFCGLLILPHAEEASVFAILVGCFTLGLPVAVASGFTMSPWLAMFLTTSSVLVTYHLLLRRQKQRQHLFAGASLYLAPIVGIVLSLVVAHAVRRELLPRDTSSLIDMMADCRIERSTAAARELLAQGKGPLLQALEHRDPAVRARAAQFLGLLNDPSVEEVLIGAMSDGDPYVRMWSVMSLGRVGGKEALRALARLADDDDPIVRREAGEAKQAIVRRLQ